jgi:hypothetical protein
MAYRIIPESDRIYVEEFHPSPAPASRAKPQLFG